MCHFLLAFLDSGNEIIGDYCPFGILERAVLNFAKLVRAEERGERDCECGEGGYDFAYTTPQESWDQSQGEQIIEREITTLDAGKREMFLSNGAHKKLEQLTTSLLLPSDNYLHVRKNEVSGAHCVDKHQKTQNDHSNQDTEEDKVFMIDEEKDNLSLMKDVSALKRKEEGLREEEAICENICPSKVSSVRWQSWPTCIANLNTHIPDNCYSNPMFEATSIESLMQDLEEFKKVLVTLATHLNEAGDDNPCLQDQVFLEHSAIERHMSEEIRERGKDNTNLTAIKPDEQKDYLTTLDSMCNDVVAIKQGVNNLQDVLKSTVDHI